MKIIFLDIDGVLNTPTLEEHDEHHHNWPDWGPGLRGMDRRLVAKLNAFVVTGARIVISSSWRNLLPPSDIYRRLVEAGMDQELVVIGRTPSFGQSTRAHEIKHWLDTNGQDVTHYVIFDDDHDADIHGHFVQVNGSEGLSAENVEHALKILEE
jgi:hypothetical protein